LRALTPAIHLNLQPFDKPCYTAAPVQMEIFFLGLFLHKFLRCARGLPPQSHDI